MPGFRKMLGKFVDRVGKKQKEGQGSPARSLQDGDGLYIPSSTSGSAVNTVGSAVDTAKPNNEDAIVRNPELHVEAGESESRGPTPIRGGQPPTQSEDGGTAIIACGEAPLNQQSLVAPGLQKSYDESSNEAVSAMSQEPGPKSIDLPIRAASGISQQPTTKGSIPSNQACIGEGSTQDASNVAPTEPSENVKPDSPPNVITDLWDRAFEKLRGEDEKLLKGYEQCLSTDIAIDGDKSLFLGNTSGAEREKQLSGYLKHRIEVDEKSAWALKFGSETTIVLREQVDKAVKIISWAKDFVSSAVSADPHASLAWSGVCLLLPLLLNPTSERQGLVASVEAIATVIHRYVVVEEVYRRNEVSPIILESQQENYRIFEGAVVSLYAKIIEHQARSACKFHRNRLSQILRDTIKTDNLDGLLADIKMADLECQQYFTLLDSALLQKEYKRQDERHEKLIGSLDKHFSSLLKVIEEEQEDGKYWRQKEQSSKLLRALSESLDYEGNKNRNRRAVKNTCRWVLDNPKFKDWREDKTAGLLWISAYPGCGKSVLARALVDEVLACHEPQLLCYFFFKRDDSARRTSDALCALLHQIFTSESKRSLIKHALPYFEDDGQLVHKEHTLWRILIKVAQDPLAGELICVIDALDECYDFESLIGKLSNLYGESISKSNKKVLNNLKFLITSRPYRDLELGEEGLGRLVRAAPEIRISGETEAKAIREEIQLYIKDQVVSVSKDLELKEDVRDYLENRLLRVDNQTYLWLHLVFDVIRNNLVGTTTKAMESLIDKLPKSVNAAYEAILEKVPNPDEARKLFHIITGAMRPLSVAEMRFALSIDEQSTTVRGMVFEPIRSFQKIIREQCGLFINILDGKIYLIHQTARDFLLQNNDKRQKSASVAAASSGTWKHSLVPSDSHKLLAWICVHYLNFSEFESRAGDIKEELSDEEERTYSKYDDDSQASVTAVDPREGREIYLRSRLKAHVFLEYASTFWVAHLNRALAAGLELGALENSVWRLCDPKSYICQSWFEVSGIASLDLDEYNDGNMGKFETKHIGASTGEKDGTLIFCSYIGFFYGVESLASSAVQNVKAVALEFACEQGWLDIIKLLLATDNTLQEIITSDSKTLAHAIKMGHLDLAEYLRKAGAVLPAPKVREPSQKSKSKGRYRNDITPRQVDRSGDDIAETGGAFSKSSDVRQSEENSDLDALLADLGEQGIQTVEGILSRTGLPDLGELSTLASLSNVRQALFQEGVESNPLVRRRFYQPVFSTNKNLNIVPRQ